MFDQSAQSFYNSMCLTGNYHYENSHNIEPGLGEVSCQPGVE